MIKNYFKTAWRNLLKNRFYSIINISGLSAGLAVGILILLWVQDEFSFDSFHKNEKNIYKVENMVGTGDSRQLWTNTASPIGVLAKKEIPGVEDVVRISYNGRYGLFKYNDKTFSNENYFWFGGNNSGRLAAAKVYIQHQYHFRRPFYPGPRSLL